MGIAPSSDLPVGRSLRGTQGGPATHPYPRSTQPVRSRDVPAPTSTPCRSPVSVDAVVDLALGAVDGAWAEVTGRPLVDLATGEPVGFDAMVTLASARSDDDAIDPRVLLAGIDDADAARAVNGWLLTEGVADAERWRRTLGWPRTNSVVWVAVDVRFVTAVDFLPVVRTAVRNAGLEPRHLMLSVGHDACFEGAWPNLQRLKSHEVTVALEDLRLGSGGAELLRRHPFDVVRLDPDVIGRTTVATGAPFRNLVRLARNLGCRVLAEGVDDRDRLDLCRWAGCDLVTGDYVVAAVVGS